MREIKFRAWDKKKMHYFNPFNQSTEFMRNNFDGRNEIMQFTGLQDKNGKDIFEGDVVSHYPHWCDGRTKTEVKYDDEIAEFRPFGSSDWALEAKDCEVIGNVFDNPDLLIK
jgi:hypothetical protein